jgi:HSP20 family protein
MPKIEWRKLPSVKSRGAQGAILPAAPLMVPDSMWRLTMNTRYLWPSLWSRPSAEHHEPLASLRDEIERAFEGFRPSLAEPAWSGDGFAPRLDITQRDSELEVTAELPGIKPADVEVTLEGDMLTVRGEKKAETERKDAIGRVRERRWGSFSRTVRLPFEPAAEKVEAHFRDGVLALTMKVPEGAAPKPKRVEVKEG